MNAFHRIPKAFVRALEYIALHPALRVAVELILALVIVGFVLGTMWIR